MNIELDNFRPSPEPLNGTELIQAIKATEAKKAVRKRLLFTLECYAVKTVAVAFRILHSIT